MAALPAVYTGAISEAKVMVDLLQQGYQVLRPLVPCRYDLAVQKDGTTYYVQVKTGRIDKRNGTLKASWDAPYEPRDVDVMAVVDPQTDMVYYVPTAQMEDGILGVTVRYSPTSRDTSSFLAIDVQEFPAK